MVSRKTLYAFHSAISRLIMYRGSLSLNFFNSSFRQLLKIVENFKDWTIFDQVMKEILKVPQNKNQQLHKEFKK